MTILSDLREAAKAGPVDHLIKNLPIEGVSDKQVEYARKIRIQAVSSLIRSGYPKVTRQDLSYIKRGVKTLDVYVEGTIQALIHDQYVSQLLEMKVAKDILDRGAPLVTGDIQYQRYYRDHKGSLTRYRDGVRFRTVMEYDKYFDRAIEILNSDGEIPQKAIDEARADLSDERDACIAAGATP